MLAVGAGDVNGFRRISAFGAIPRPQELSLQALHLGHLADPHLPGLRLAVANALQAQLVTGSDAADGAAQGRGVADLLRTGAGDDVPTAQASGGRRLTGSRSH